MAEAFCLTKEIRLFGLAEEDLRRRLEDLLCMPRPEVALTIAAGDACLQLTVTATEEAQAQTRLQELTDDITQRLHPYIYEGDSLEQGVVALLTRHGKTVATAESCTGGLVSARLTGIPGSSRVFGTGVVSYSPDCKNKLLDVSAATLEQEGTVCSATAGQMARGVRQMAGADIGVSVTGEAGPTAAEDHPVGTVFIALADQKRTWVRELHLSGERQTIRQQAAGHVLDLLRRYLEAYPAVMAGGIANGTAKKRDIPRTQGAVHPRLLARLFPWKGDSLRKILLKSLVWLLALALATGGGWAVYHNLLESDNNRQLQDSLGEMYWNDASSPVQITDPLAANYPNGMLAQFRGLYDMNKDVGGWIHIPDTTVDYPLMSYRNGYYKNHNFKQQYSVYGQPYFAQDTVLSPLTNSRTLTIYGKNTEDGQMFSELLNYRRVAYLQEHPVITMDTLYTSGHWEIFAVLVADERNQEECNYAQSVFEDDTAFMTYVEALQERSLFHADCTVTAADRLLLLSVNAAEEYDYSAARLVIAARLIEAQESTVTYRVNGAAKMPAALNRYTPQTASRTTTSTTERTDASTTGTTTTTGTTSTIDTTTITDTTNTTVTTGSDPTTSTSTGTTTSTTGTTTTTGSETTAGTTTTDSTTSTATTTTLPDGSSTSPTQSTTSADEDNSTTDASSSDTTTVDEPTSVAQPDESEPTQPEEPPMNTEEDDVPVTEETP